MDKWICIAVCFLISVLIYYLLKSYGINNIIEGQCTAENKSGLCNFNYEDSAQNICNSIIDITGCGPLDDIPCSDIEDLCNTANLGPPDTEKSVPVKGYTSDIATGLCCTAPQEEPDVCTTAAPLQTVTDTAPVNPAYGDDSTYGKGKHTATECCGLYDADARNIYTEACNGDKFTDLPAGDTKEAIRTQLSTYRTKLWATLLAERPSACTNAWPDEPTTECSQ